MSRIGPIFADVEMALKRGDGALANGAQGSVALTTSGWKSKGAWPHVFAERCFLAQDRLVVAWAVLWNAKMKGKIGFLVIGHVY